jgi:hypothetical protein
MKYTLTLGITDMNAGQWIAIIIPVFTAIFITIFLPILRKPEDTDNIEMYQNVSAANLQICSECGNEYAMTLQECPRCETPSKVK